MNDETVPDPIDYTEILKKEKIIEADLVPPVLDRRFRMTEDFVCGWKNGVMSIIIEGGAEYKMSVKTPYDLVRVDEVEARGIKMFDSIKLADSKS